MRIESGAGAAANFSDEAYAAAGAQIAGSAAELLELAIRCEPGGHADNVAAALEFRKAIDLDRHFIAAHIAYIDATVTAKRAEAKANGWTVVDMKNDWERVFAFDK